MLAYPSHKPAIGARQSSPNILLIVIGAHVAAIAALMSARVELPTRKPDPPTIVTTIKQLPPPPPIEHQRTATHPTEEPTYRPTTVDPTDPMIKPLEYSEVLTGTTPGDPRPTIESRPPIQPPLHFDPPVKTGPKLMTPASELRPPYPPSKILTEEEAVLTLRLTIDDRGHVIAVDPVGHADRAFVDAARRHLIAHWRYQPANEDGRAIASSLVVTLRFMLDE